MRRRGVSQALTPWQKMELVIGPSGPTSWFANDEERREAWHLHEAELLTFGNYRPGKRCWAWWQYSSPEPPSDVIDEVRDVQYLKRIGVLSDQEIIDFEKDHGPIDELEGWLL